MITSRYQEIEKVTKYSNYYLGKCYTWLSTPITERAAAWGIHPNVLTLISLVVGLAGCYFAATGHHSLVVLGAWLLYVSYVLDWCDGQLARFTGKVSPFGGWLDQICDRLKETAYIFAVSYGAVQSGGDSHTWIWAFLSLFFLFLLEYYGQMSRSIPEVDRAPAAHVLNGVPSHEEGYSSISQLAAAAEPTAEGLPITSVRKVVIDFSIDEQYFVLVAGLLIIGEKNTLIVIAILAGLMAVYKPLKGWLRYFKSRRSLS